MEDWNEDRPFAAPRDPIPNSFRRGGNGGLLMKLDDVDDVDEVEVDDIDEVDIVDCDRFGRAGTTGRVMLFESEGL